MHDVVGRVLVLNGEPFPVIGILPDDYRPGLGLFVPEIYVPIGSLPTGDLQDRRPASFDLRGRLAPGTTATGADAFQAAARRLDPHSREKTKALVVRR